MGYNAYQLPWLSSYAAAVKRYEGTTPIRGHKDAVRPLGTRRHHMNASIEKHGDKIVLMYEGFVSVIWQPDDTFTICAPKYYNAYQADKMAGLLPNGCSFMWNGGRLFVTADHGRHKHYLPRGGSLVFKPDGVNTAYGHVRYMCVNPEVPLEYKMRRNAQSRLVNKHFTPFLSWARVVLGMNARYKNEELEPACEAFLTELGYSQEQIESHTKAVEKLDYGSEHRAAVFRFVSQLNRFPFPTSGGDKCFSRPACELMFKHLATDDATRWPDMLAIIIKRAGRYHWGSGIAGSNSGYVVTYEDVEDYLQHLVSFLFHDQVFEIEQLEPGQVPSKRNARYKNEVVHVF